MGITARSRASLSLKATTALQSTDALAAVEAAAAEVKGGGASLLTTGVTNLGAQVNVERRHADRLEFSITSGKRIVELMTMTARVTRSGERTTLTISIDSYKTQQSKFFMLIPAGPKQIHGMAPYKRFLEGVERTLRSRDPSASVAIGQVV
jgi:hypothetical protein